MKINLECGQDIRQGFVNVNSVPVENPHNYDFRVGDPRNLDEIVEDGKAEQIVANELLTRFHPSEVVSVVQRWIQKLQKGGKLIVTFVDFRLVAQEIYLNNLSIENIHVLIYGQNNEKQSICDVDTAKILVEKLGMNVEHVSIKDTVVYVEAVK